MFEPLIDLHTQDRIVVAIIVISGAIGIIGIMLGWAMVAIAAASFVPWLLILARKFEGDYRQFGWLAVFEILVIMQLFHFAEHVSQIIELHFLDWAPSIARGIVGELDIEPVHMWWNTAILFGATLLLLRYKQNRWLWASWLFSIWHQIEHTYVYLWWFIPKGVSGHPGIFGAGGLVDQANISIPVLTDLGRADLHFWYNFFEIGLFVVAFVAQALARPRLAAAPGTTTTHTRRRALIVVGALQFALILGLALAHYSPRTLRVPENYPTIQATIDAAPEWAIVRIAPGTYAETLRITKPITLIGAGEGKTRLVNNDDTTPVIAIEKTNGVILRQLTIVGGLYGILVEESTAVQILKSQVLNAWFGGIRLSRASAEIIANEVRGTRSPFGMGIELANTASKPPSMIRDNIVADNPHEGIILHNSGAMIENNTVTGNGLRGIAVTEMSMATVRGNTMRENADAGIFVVDSSMADILSNRISAVKPGPTGAADGIRAYYYAEVMLGQNTIDVPKDRAVVSGYEATIENQ